MKISSNVISVLGKTPRIGNNCFIAPTAMLIGDVILGDNCSVWFNAVIRGDVNYIKIGNNVNIQDGVIIHGTYKRAPVEIGNYVSIAHRAIIHGCTIKDKVLIGMGAIIMDHCIINGYTIIAAGSVVLENTIVEEYSIYAGIPAKKIKSITPELIEQEIERIANNYLLYSSWYKNA